LLLHAYFGDIRDCYQDIVALPFDGLGLDFVEGDNDASHSIYRANAQLHSACAKIADAEVQNRVLVAAARKMRRAT
jgi:hypothetical protein